MKKLFLTAAFTLVGVIAVSAQTDQKPAEETKNLRLLKPNNRIQRLTPTQDTGTPQQNTTTTVETAPLLKQRQVK
jgi:hypothetical protein